MWLVIGAEAFVASNTPGIQSPWAAHTSVTSLSFPFVLKIVLSFAKMPSVFIFIAFQIARVGGSERLLTVKKPGTLFDSSAGWSFGEGQVPRKGQRAGH
jgi:hypothetical protein